MTRRRKKNAQPVVAILVDGVTSFGRAIMRGAMRYANLQRRWLIHEEMRNRFNPESWPHFDGAIVAGVRSEISDFVLKNCKNVVRCSGNGDPEKSGVVCADDFAIGQIAAEHLLDTRLTHFGFYGRNQAKLAQRRYAGFSQTVAARNCSCQEAGLGWPTAIESDGVNDWPALIAWLRQLPKPVGILAVDDVAAHDLAAACRAGKFSVPDQIAILGVNNDDLLCESAWPPLSSVEIDYSRVGYSAARLIEAMLAGGAKRPKDRLITVQPLGVVRRQSTELLAVDDFQLAAAVKYIREHACDPCTVSDILKHVPVGRRWLERQFVAKLGRSPHDEIMHVRVEAAKRMLLQPELKIAEIAERFGSSAIQNFNRAFAQIVGKTPAAWRNSARQTPA